MRVVSVRSIRRKGLRIEGGAAGLSFVLTSKNPFATAPLAWTTRSGILSLSNCASFSSRW